MNFFLKLEKLVKLVIDTGSEENYQKITKKLPNNTNLTSMKKLFCIFCIFIFFVFLWKDNFVALFHESAMYIKHDIGNF